MPGRHLVFAEAVVNILGVDLAWRCRPDPDAVDVAHGGLHRGMSLQEEAVVTHAPFSFSVKGPPGSWG